MQPFISVCIPAYKNTLYLKRLLDSIAKQTYKDFEVIVTDDSPGNDVEALCLQYAQQFKILYTKNTPAVGMPGNWNVAIEKANGEWIKLMHDDDWFAHSKSLQAFAAATSTATNFIVCDYINVYQENDKHEKVAFPLSKKNAILIEPMLLMAKNIIGPPSVSMVRKHAHLRYDVRLRWRVDIDYYISLLMTYKNITYIPESLVYVGLNNLQLTNVTKNHPEVELPEAFILLKKYGTAPLRNVLVYDAWWRMFRNMQIFSYEKLLHYSPEDWDTVIQEMLADLNNIPEKLLKAGALSKTCMAFSYVKNRKHIH